MIDAFVFNNRARQGEQKEMKKKLQAELEPGNPNWEFLHMIRYLPECTLMLRRGDGWGLSRGNLPLVTGSR